jgi:hypothetical protein
MFEGLPEYSSMVCELLVKENRMDEAKGVFNRAGLKVSDFNKLYGGKINIGAEIEKHKYNKDKDWKPAEDFFEPMSSPPSDYISLPIDVKYDLVDTEENISKLLVLRG